VKSTPEKGSRFAFTLPKLSREETLVANINSLIKAAREADKEMSLFLLKIENYEQISQRISKEKARQLTVVLQQAFRNIMRQGERVLERTDGQLLAAFEVGKEAHGVIAHRLKRITKDIFFAETGGELATFFYGWAVSPKDGGDAQELLAHIESNLIDEGKERMEKTIMIIDDEHFFVAGLQEILGKAGYKIFQEANDGMTALQKIKEKLPDVVIVDIHMPFMSGYEIIGRLKESFRTKDIPILIMSAYNVDQNKLEEFGQIQAIPVVSKPFNEQEVVKKIDYLL
jgi:CheY-like chemotaxis protein/GGDEF domain-containing protein